MPAWDTILNRVRYFSRRSQFDSELDDEIFFHIEARADELVERGMPPQAANEQARREFGSRALATEESRSAWQVTWLEDFWRDICYAARGWVAHPVFTAVAILSLATGVGANCAMFIVVDALLLRPLAVYHPYEIISIHETSVEGGTQGLSWHDYADLRDRNRSFTGLVALSSVSAGFATVAGQPAKTRDGQFVSGNYFDSLGVPPALGRSFSAEEDQVSGRNPVVVISYGLWQDAFHSDRNVPGRQVWIAGVPFTVIGVAPRDFLAFDESLTEDYPDYFIPLAMAPLVGEDPKFLESRETRSLTVVGRLKPGIAIEEGQAELATIASAIDKAHPENKHEQRMVVQSVVKYRAAGFGGDAGIAIMILSGAVLLVACANVAGLLLSRAASRKREIAVRLSLGAGRIRLIRQLLTETCLIALAGAVVGVAMAEVPLAFVKTVMYEIVAQASDTIPLRLDERAVLFSVALALMSVMLSGLWPAVHATRQDLNVAMNGGEPAARPPRRNLWGRNLLVAGQVAIAVMLLTATGVIYQWVSNARGEIDNAGFDTTEIVTIHLDPLVKKLRGDKARQFYELLSDRIRSLSATTAITLASAGEPTVIRTDMQDAALQSVRGIQADHNFFDAQGIQILRGRGFRSTDAFGTTPVAVVNERLAKTVWPEEDPLGKRVRVGDDKNPWAEIIGVAKIRNYDGVNQIPSPQLIFQPVEQGASWPQLTLFARPRGERWAVASAIRRAVREIDAKQAAPDIKPWGEQLNFFSRGIGIAAIVILLMGATGVGLAMIGLYGMVSYDAGTRTRELGVRAALGATRGALLRLTMTQGVALAFFGIVAGIVVNRSLTKLLIGNLNGGASDGVSVTWGDGYFAALGLGVLFLAALAAYLPARKATAANCCEAIRCE